MRCSRRRTCAGRFRLPSSPRGRPSAASLTRLGIGGCPEETAPPPALLALALPASSRQRKRARPEACSRAFAPRAASFDRCASITATVERRAAMDRLYGQFVRRGDLVFDIGAHVGDRVARVPPARRARGRGRAAARAGDDARLIYGRDSNVVDRAGGGRPHPGAIELRINVDNPTVSTASRAFVDAAARRARLGRAASGASRSACR